MFSGARIAGLLLETTDPRLDDRYRDIALLFVGKRGALGERSS